MRYEKFYFNAITLLVFLVHFIPSFSSCMHRRLLKSNSIEDKIASNEAFASNPQIRSANVLTQSMIDEVCKRRGIRVLVIGGRVAVADNVERNEAYPYLLCNSDKIAGKNLTLDDMVPCAKKIIGENIYDAIILDLFDQSNEKLIELTRRLVNRFPEATIISMMQWFPGDVGFRHRKGWANVARWAKAMGQNSMTKDALELFQNSTRPWTIKLHKQKTKFSERNVNENSIWSLRKDTKDEIKEKGEYWKNTLLRRAWMFDDWFLPGSDGHKDIARGILGLLISNETETFRQDTVEEWDDDYGTC